MTMDIDFGDKYKVKYNDGRVEKKTRSFKHSNWFNNIIKADTMPFINYSREESISNSYNLDSEGNIVARNSYTSPIIINKKGRKVWNLNFSLYDDNKLLSQNTNISRYIEGDYEAAINNELYSTSDLQVSSEYTSGQEFKSTGLYDANSFFTNVLNWICMGDRFIFQPNSDYSGGDSYYLCEVDLDEISNKRKYDRIYEFKLQIIEVIN